MTYDTIETNNGLAGLSAGTVAATPPPIPAAIGDIEEVAAGAQSTVKADVAKVEAAAAPALADITAAKTAVAAKTSGLLAEIEAIPGEISHTLKAVIAKIKEAEVMLIGHFAGVEAAAVADEAKAAAGIAAVKQAV